MRSAPLVLDFPYSDVSEFDHISMLLKVDMPSRSIHERWFTFKFGGSAHLIPFSIPSFVLHNPLPILPIRNFWAVGDNFCVIPFALRLLILRIGCTHIV